MSSPNKPGAAHSSHVDSGARIRTVMELAPQTVTAPAAEFEGITIDRAAHEMPLSCQFAFPMVVPLASGESVDVQVTVQDATTAAPDDPTSSTPGSFADYGDEQPDPVTLVGNDDGSPLETTVTVNVDLAGARRFVRALIDVPASGELSLSGVCVISGTERFPL
jgi:hypothetical protein